MRLDINLYVKLHEREFSAAKSFSRHQHHILFVEIKARLVIRLEHVNENLIVIFVSLLCTMILWTIQISPANVV